MMYFVIEKTQNINKCNKQSKKDNDKQRGALSGDQGDVGKGRRECSEGKEIKNDQGTNPPLNVIVIYHKYIVIK